MRKLGWAALSMVMLAGCASPSGVVGSPSAASSDTFDANAYEQLGGAAYASFKLAPQLPSASDQRNATKLTYLMTDEVHHQSQWAQQMLQMMDELPQHNVHNVVFRDGAELGDSRLYYLQGGDGNATSIHAAQSLLAPGVSEVQSNNPKVFSQIVGQTFDRYPGQRKYLELYTHGAGVFGVGCDEKQTDPKGKLLPDDQNIWAMPIYDFNTALRQGLKGRQLDALYFRACLMGNVEALYELRGTVRYVMASEDVSSSVDNSNLTMTKQFDDLAASNTDPAEIARQIAITAHAKRPNTSSGYSGYDTFAAVDIGKMDELKSAVNTLSHALIDDLPRERAAITAAYDSVPTIHNTMQADEYYLQMRDLWALTAQLMQAKLKDSAVNQAVQQVRAAQTAAMIHEKDAFGSADNGLSIFMPTRDQFAKYAKFLKGTYQKTRFAKDTAWDDFLQALAQS